MVGAQLILVRGSSSIDMPKEIVRSPAFSVVFPAVSLFLNYVSRLQLLEFSTLLPLPLLHLSSLLPLISPWL